MFGRRWRWVSEVFETEIPISGRRPRNQNRPAPPTIAEQISRNAGAQGAAISRDMMTILPMLRRITLTRSVWRHAAAIILVATPAALSAQWLGYATPGVPHTPDGKPKPLGSGSRAQPMEN